MSSARALSKGLVSSIEVHVNLCLRLQLKRLMEGASVGASTAKSKLSYSTERHPCLRSRSEYECPNLPGVRSLITSYRCQDFDGNPR